MEHKDATMTTQIVTQEPVSLVLTQEELTFLLALMDVSYIPGFEVPPLTSGDDQLREAFALQYAERSLRARGLAEIGADQRLLVNTELQSMLRTCASPDYALLVQQTAGSGEQQSYSGQRKADQVVVHLEPNPTFHQFTVVQDVSAFVDLIIASSNFQDIPEQPERMVHIQGDQLALVRSAVERDDTTGAMDILAASEVPTEAATALVATLASAYGLLTILELRWQNDEDVTQREVTVIQALDQVWVMYEDSEQTDVYILQPISHNSLRQLLLTNNDVSTATTR